VSGVLKETSRSVVGSRSLLAKGLLVVQVATSLVLLIGAGLFLRTLDNLRNVDIGFDPRNLVLFRVNPQLNRYDEQRLTLLFRDMIDRVGAIPGVRAVALSNPLLLTGNESSTSIFVHGRTYATPETQQDSINRVEISPNLFDVLGIPLVDGRRFTDAENNATAPKVVIINETAVRKYFPNQNPIGQRFGSSVENSGQLEIVGVLRDAKYNSVRDAAPPTMYVPYLQSRRFGAFVVRTEGDPVRLVAPIREAIRAVDPNVPIQDVFTQMEQVERRLAQEKVFAQVCTLFGGLALLLAAIGLFGVMSYNVARRTNEIGIRIALGAQRGAVLGATLRESLLLVVIGAGVGFAAAIGTSRFIAAQLFGVAPNDAFTISIAVAVLMAVAAIAAYLPARRASRVDPMVALRYE
jgi:predicted permease